MTIRSVVGASEGYGSSRFSISAANPYANHGEFYPIATVTVGSGGASEAVFSDIPGTFQHLQIRAILRRSTGTNSNNFVRFNSDTGSNYAWHRLQGDGSSAAATASSSASTMEVFWSHANVTNVNNQFAGGVIDILDYANTSKTKVLRSFGGNDMNGGGQVQLHSGLWNSTSAITAIRLYTNDTWAQYSQVCLYGLRAP